LSIDESKYGCGALLRPGKTYYVSQRGDDEADGTSWETAWRHIHVGLPELRAGDALVIGEGEYVEPEMEVVRSGERGRPITIMAAPRHRVIISTAVRPHLERTPNTEFVWEATLRLKDGRAMVWEGDTKILLQSVAGVAMVDELPGTWWYDREQQKVYAHFSDSRTTGSPALAIRPGRASVSHFSNRDVCALDIRGSFVRINGLWFEHDNVCLVVQGDSVQNEDGTKSYRGGDHVTIEDCAFSSTCFAGLVLYAGARWNLIKGNYGALNGARGSLLVNHRDTQDNLFIGNRLDPSTPTIRERGWKYHFGISTYGHVGPRNHVVGNMMNDTHSFRCKYMFRNTVIQGNIMLGSCSTVPCTYPGSRPEELWKKPEDRVIFRNNVFLSSASTAYQPMPPCGPGGNWCDRFKVFVNNFAPNKANRTHSIAAARFADPACLDYRLQADSPLRGRALGGGDVGAYRKPQGRIFYVSPKGSDGNAGTSDQRPLATLAKANAALQAGDTLYVMPGTYPRPLVIASSGRKEAPITIRARGRADLSLPSVHVEGSWVDLEGLTVAGRAAVTGSNVILKQCIVRGRAEAVGAKALTLGGCTAETLSLKQGSTDAVVRDCIFGAIEISQDSRPGYLASNNCYFGDGLDRERIADEIGSIVADPKFVDAAKGDFRLQWDSPAAHVAPFGRPAGAKPPLKRTPEIECVEVSGISRDSAIITWRTPKDDTTARVYWRKGEAKQWRRLDRAELGTVHGVGLTGLEPETEYAFRIEAKSRRGGVTQSAAASFTASAEAHTATTYYLAPDGRDSADGLGPQTAWRTIRRASFAVAPGDTVLIAPGVYRHAIAPLCGGAEGRRITFRRHGGGNVVIDASGVVAPLVVLDHKHYVTVEGITFENLPPEGHPGVVRGNYSKGLELLRCRIGLKRRHGGFGNGLNLYRCDDARIEGNVIWGTRYHVVPNQCSNVLIKNNTFTWGQVFSVHFLGKHDGCRFVNNIFYYPTSVPNAALAINYPTRELKLTSDYNLFGPMVNRTHVAYVYARSLSKLQASGPELEDWQQSSGQDAHSIQADPKFVNPRAGDFRLLPDSPAIGAGEGGVNIGACGAANLGIRGRTSLLPGEGRTIRLEAHFTGSSPGAAVFRWRLPRGEERQGAALDYLPPGDVSRFEVRVTTTDPRGNVSEATEYISVPPPELARPDGKVVKVEAEDFVDQGGGEVGFYKLINTSGRAITHWNKSVGHWLEWDFDVPSNGKYLIYARYTTRLENRSRSLTLDGVSPGAAYEKIAFPCTGGWSLSEDNWAFKKLGPPVSMQAGKHRLRMTNLDSAVNLDYLVVVPATKCERNLP